MALERPPFLTRVRTPRFDRYGPQRDSGHLDPISQFILAKISARTRDEISLPAFLRRDRKTARFQPPPELAGEIRA